MNVIDFVWKKQLSRLYLVFQVYSLFKNTLFFLHHHFNYFVWEDNENEFGEETEIEVNFSKGNELSW